MPSCCRTCDHRNHDVHTNPSTPTLLDVCLITLCFKTALLTSSPNSTALNAVLNNITDAAESTSHPSTFTAWSPCLSNPQIAVVLTTASETCGKPTSAVFEPVLKYLESPPCVQHVFHEYSILSLAASSPDEKVPCDIIVLRAPNPGVAGAIGKRFGWDPKRSSLSSQLEAGASAGFSRPGDLVRDFWAWAELHANDPSSPSCSSVGSGYESADTRPGLMSTNSSEKNMSLFFAEDEERRNMEDETLIMLFQWRSLVDAERFKHPLQKSYGQNEEEVSTDLWDRHVAHPVRQLQGIGAKADMYRLELRGVEPRMQTAKAAAGRERSGSRRLSTMATGLGEKVSGLWR
ncbi:hypothetical protein BU26DRAFT_557572 [Trematosphaeria pertusa]|uniref:Uncharacterized protein n=1 Tax=Trematosphaeria pertusa TaxID=390896 RepID=A0A6A6J0E7_9PLEO|nr:uncharacterized protein BU26DRAFT_557572 [Trematosphaeria pertusa]KAF2256096.1 hypothetical protein BU26DRAFT_557572 [Trematosphaeria pertusa]